ncbi:succinylglutamate desuccinylase/aspartoacylase family protein [Muricauda sp. CAU 1633]|uniref:succinylglutamate desuccinylase/aspartoacylase family protein n=1 Tax=Allomuricauda sp. CAU 1633 TaxID=2816036 RepID=UPI001A8D7E3A|nr:succinylglutamate desuccinylase/aspartoacylase family protein [Muricauda sp. CAU 1633]MBO0322983.1 succinylglutamate desuccinylase/aspartoacylase family protein [Muricauda sp. CAU 1633]
MQEVQKNDLKETTTVERIIGHLSGNREGPTVVFFAGIHGNEPAGVLALKQVFKRLIAKKVDLEGEIFAVAGNLGALKKQVRFQAVDLNRIWFPERISNILSDEHNNNAEEEELKLLYGVLCKILEKGNPPFYFIDLHTTSSDTTPFIVLNDSLLNRKYASNYPLPIILGIEEYLEGALLSYINELGYVSLGFESGQHNDSKAVENCVDFIEFTLQLTDVVRTSKSDGNGFNNASHTFYEIYHQHTIGAEDIFRMFPGFTNFQEVPKGTEIAVNNDAVLKTKKRRQIFMPLYQDQGGEGFYFIRPIPKFLLWLSKELRRFKVDHLLVKLPGVQWKSDKKDTLLVDQRIARFMAKSIFHLLGYRARQFDETHLVVKSREIASRNNEYKGAGWF